MTAEHAHGIDTGGEVEAVGGHTRTSTPSGPDFCDECSRAAGDWVAWPCNASPRAMGSHHSARAGTTTWLTPPHIIEAVGPFDLDPCAARGWNTAAEHYVLPQDGLALPWHGMVWLNPPYGAEVWSWLDRLAAHGNGIALIFARTETAGFVEQVWEKADGVLFLHGRLYFHHADGTRAAANSGAPSCLVAYGSDAARRLEECALPGSYVSGWRRLLGHESVSYDLTCPRQYTARGGWNIYCECGASLGDTGYSDSEQETLRQMHLRVVHSRITPSTHASAADAVLAEARQLCCGNNPSPHHAASAKHSERMAFAGDLARAVRGL